MEVEYKFLCHGELNIAKRDEIIGALEQNGLIYVIAVELNDIGTKYLDSVTGSLRKENIAVRDRHENSHTVSFVGADFFKGDFTPIEFEDAFGKEIREEVERFAGSETAHEDKHILSFKWGGSSENGLHKRNEVELDLTDGDIEFWKLNRNVYRKFRMAEKERLVDLSTTMVRRSKIFVLFNGSMVEVCIDTGFFFKNKGKMSVTDKEILRAVEKNEADEEKEILDLISELPESHRISEIELELNKGSEQDLKALADYLSGKFNLIPNEVSEFQRGLELYKIIWV